jgi:hypothetical protein
MKKVIVFHKPHCFACDQLKEYLESRRIAYKAVNGQSADGRALMLTNGVFLSFFPGLCVDGRLYEYAHLFDEKGGILTKMLEDILDA